MLKEALDRVVELANAAATPKPIDLPKEPANVYGVVYKGEVSLQEAQPPLRNHNVLSLEAVTDWGQWLGGEPDVPNDNTERVVVWYNRNAVIALNDADRRNKATYKLTASEQMEFFAKIPRNGTFARKSPEFVRVLRTTLAGCFPSVPTLLDTIREYKFITVKESEGSSTRDKSSIGTRLTAQLAGNSPPETVVFDIPVFENLELPRERITCTCDPDPHGEQFTLTPLPGEVERAWRGAEASIRGRLEELVVDGWSGSLCYGEP